MSPPSLLVCRKAIVKGRVQGVGFRANTLREALRIGNLQGWVRNLPSGEVEIVVQGDEDSVHRLLDWARHGPPSAVVDGLTEELANVDPALPVFAIKS